MVHTKEKNFECSVCGKRFGLKHNLNVHERMHKGQGKPCLYCIRTFTVAATLKNHVLQHKEKNHAITDDPQIKQTQIIKASRGRPSLQQTEKIV